MGFPPCPGASLPRFPARQPPGDATGRTCPQEIEKQGDLWIESKMILDTEHVQHVSRPGSLHLSASSCVVA